jgi:hypothetical protein
MQQHRFALQYRWEEVSQRLLPMIEQCQRFLAEADAVASPRGGDAATAAASGGRMAELATGMFSWRMPPEGTGEGRPAICLYARVRSTCPLDLRIHIHPRSAQAATRAPLRGRGGLGSEGVTSEVTLHPRSCQQQVMGKVRLDLTSSIQNDTFFHAHLRYNIRVQP